MFDRNCWIPVFRAGGLPPVRYDFGGISGGPMLSVVERNGFRSWALAGIIYEGPNPSIEEGQRCPEFETIRRGALTSSERTVSLIFRLEDAP